jgi:SAM-dependent methyltransferase
LNYGIVPETLAERAALWLGQVPVPMADLVLGPLKARIVMAGVTLGVFEGLRDGSRTAGDLAQALSLDPQALELLIRALVHVKYLEQDGDTFGLSSLGRSTMIAGSARELTSFARWNETQWRFFERLDDLVRTGRGLDIHHTLDDANSWSYYQRAMFEAARYDAGALARLVPVPAGAQQLLDLGGSHGLLGAAICRAHPPMRSTVIDLPQAVVHSRIVAHDAGLDDIVNHRPADLRIDSLEECDVALLSNVLHHFTAAEMLALLGRVRSVLRPHGTIAIWEFEAPSPGAPAGGNDLMAFFFRLTSSADMLHATQYADYLVDAGFVRVRILRPLRSPGRVLVLGKAAALRV